MTTPAFASDLQPSLLGRMNERRIVQLLQARGPLSRAEVAREAGLSAPTVSKAVAALLAAGLLEENEEADATRGRPAKKLRLANENVQVLGVVIDAGRCHLVAAGMDGKRYPDTERAVPLPKTYRELIDALAASARELIRGTDRVTRGVGVCLPGLLDYRQQQGVLSPNVPLTDGHAPARDLSKRLGVPCFMLQESHALCLAERQFGNARGLDDFAMLDVSTGVGLGVMSGGRLLTGHRGLAGEIGHLTVVEDGRRCGCGNDGCLETVGGDAALVWRVAQKLGKPLTIDDVIQQAATGKVKLARELDDTCRYLAIGVAAVINLFNPSTLFVHGRLFECDPTLFARMVELAKKRALPPSFGDCQIVQARGSKRQGAIAGIIQHLTSAIAPTLKGDMIHTTAMPSANRC